MTFVPFCSIPAYDDEMLQTGHGSIISEISNQLGSIPDAIFCSVGGAGLLGGVIKGCESSGWNDGKSIRDMQRINELL